MSSANKKIVASATIFCFIGQRSAASCSASNVPLHYTPRTGRTAFPLSVRGQRSVALYSANRLRGIPVIGSRTAFRCIISRGQRSVASYSANRPYSIPAVGSRATFRCIMLREQAIQHSRCRFADSVSLYHIPWATFRCIILREQAVQHFRCRFAGNVPLHHTPRTGRTAFPLSVRGQRFVASCSANGPHGIPVIRSRTAFRCIMLRANARRRHGGARRTRHSSTVKVDPLPGVLSTEMLPPQSLHMRWQMASPSPLPAPGFA